MKGGIVLLIAGVFLVVYCTPLAAADDGDEVVEGENTDADDDDGDSIADDDDYAIELEEGPNVESRRAVKGAHARAGHAKHARAGSRHAAGRAAVRPHARSGAARRAAHRA
ncbi:uncharacterized protein LOC126282251 [Schistocerca gregaria]|uniref:uncharacterized protein LOC126282251 n=1 Tax=Schistocerca gregaria TaxID=7010 RepID=UPI00211F1B4E|nr:uncharacterized protein LOC126282251 [Schistocerca gregaria]